MELLLKEGIRLPLYTKCIASTINGAPGLLDQVTNRS